MPAVARSEGPLPETTRDFVKKQTVPSEDFVSRQGRSAARIVDGLIDFVAPRAPPMKIGNVPAHGTRDGRLAVQLIALVDCQSRKRPVAADRFWPATAIALDVVTCLMRAEGG